MSQPRVPDKTVLKAIAGRTKQVVVGPTIMDMLAVLKTNRSMAFKRFARFEKAGLVQHHDDGTYTLTLAGMRALSEQGDS